MKEVNELDKAELKHEFRQLYNQVGYEGCIQCLYEILLSANVLAELMIEERAKEDEL